MSKINIDRIVRDIKTRSTSLTPVIEAICNSIDAIAPDRTDGKIDVIVKRDAQMELDFEGTRGIPDIVAIDVVDNGDGFTKDNRDSFDTFLSGLKMDRGGKGFGRFMYLKYFSHVSVESIYEEDGLFRKRTFTFGHKSEIIENENDEPITLSENQHTGTTLHLYDIKSRDLDKGLEVIARKLVERLLVHFVTGGVHTPRISIIEDNDRRQQIILNNYIGSSSDICQVGGDKPLKLKGKTKEIDLLIKVYKIYYSNITNKICLTANKREVVDSPLHNYVPEFKESMTEILEDGTTKNFTIKAYVIGDYLDENVTTERDAFNFGEEEDTMFQLSEREIYRESSKVVKDFFNNDIETRFMAKKQKVEHYVFNEAPWNKSLMSDIDMESIPVDISDFDLEMLFQQKKFDKEQKAKIALLELQNRQQEQKSEEDDGYEEEVNEILRSVTDTAKNDLTHYVCQRKKVLDLFEDLRRRIDNGKTHKEKEMHSLIFPMITNDRRVEYDNHNLWLLDERFNFTQFVSSDEVISRVDHKEPDLAIFYESGLFYRNGENNATSPIAIVEFKRPKRDNYPANENPIAQALDYADKILEGKYETRDGLEEVVVNRAVTPVYIYIVCDITKKIENFASMSNLSKTPDNQGYIGYMKDYNAYIEIKSYKKVYEDAKMRNQIFFKKLGLV